MGSKKKAKNIDSHLRVKTTAQLENELKDLLKVPDPDGPLDLSLAQEWPQPGQYINGRPVNEEERKKQEAYENARSQ